MGLNGRVPCSIPSTTKKEKDLGENLGLSYAVQQCNITFHLHPSSGNNFCSFLPSEWNVTEGILKYWSGPMILLVMFLV